MRYTLNGGRESDLNSAMKDTADSNAITHNLVDVHNHRIRLHIHAICHIVYGLGYQLQID
jgi:DNA-binding response OmpR family regulator